MKKIGVILLIVSMVIGTVGCGKKPTINQVNAAEHFIKVETFDEVKDYFKDVMKRNNRQYSLFDKLLGRVKFTSATEEAVFESAQNDEMNSNTGAGPTMVDDKASSDGTYTKTNTQVDGVDEADIIKTDGKYIFSVVNNNMISIVATDNGKMKVVSEIVAKDNDRWISEIFIDENRLVVIWNRNFYRILEENEKIDSKQSGSSGSSSSSSSSGSDSSEATTTEEIPASDKVSILPGEDAIWRPSKQMVSVDVYDTTNIEKPTLLKSLEVEGNLVSSRKMDGVMYLVTNKYNYIYEPAQIKEDEIIPYVSEDGSEPVRIGYDKLMILPDTNAEVFTNILTLDIFNTDSNNITSYLTGAGGAMYMNTKSLYLTDTRWNQDKITTSINKFSIEGANVNFVATGEVDGTIINQFAMDEYNGFFRIATTVNMTNGIYVFDKDMKQVGKVNGLAEGEMIYSVRYTGEKAYMVTFKTMDPLFVIDLSDPTNPKVLGELKIPGFSNYMHPVSDNTVLGLGRDTVEQYEKDRAGNEVVVGFRIGGIKLSLFDVSNPENPIEKKQIIIGEQYTNSETLYNHKALMVDKERGIFGIPVEEYNYNKGISTGKVVLVKATEHELELYGTIELPQDGEGWYYYNARALSINDSIYVKAGVEMHSYSYDDLRHVQSIKLGSR